MSPFKIVHNTDVLVGAGTALRVAQALPRSGSGVAAVVDDALVGLLPFQELVANLESRCDLIPLPVGSDHPAGLEKLASELKPYGSVYVVGGGSTIDTVRLSALMATYGRRFTSFLVHERRSGIVVFGEQVQPSIEVTALPTTIGTSAEVSPVACLTVGGAKRLAIGSGLRASAAVIDPDLSTTLPRNLVEDGVREIVLRLAGVFLGSPGRLTISDDATIVHLDALRRTLAALESTQGGAWNDTDLRIDVALRSLDTRIGFAPVGRDRYASRLWYLATSLADVAERPKMSAQRRLLPTLLDRIRAGDTRFGCAHNLARLERDDAFESWFDANPPDWHFDADAAAEHACRYWLSPMLEHIGAEDVHRFYIDAASRSVTNQPAPSGLTADTNL